MNQVRLSTVFVMCLGTLMACASSSSPGGQQVISAELKTLSQARLEAYNNFNTDGFISFHWADKRFVYARDGMIIQGIVPWSAAVRAGHGAFEEVRVSVISEDIAVLGTEAAVMTQVFDIAGLKRSGGRYIGRGTQTLVWQKRDGRWVVVNLAETKSKDYGER